MHCIPGTSLMKYYNNKELLIKRYFTPHFPYLASFFHENQFIKKRDLKIVIFDYLSREIPTRDIFVAIVVYPVLSTYCDSTLNKQWLIPSTWFPINYSEQFYHSIQYKKCS